MLKSFFFFLRKKKKGSSWKKRIREKIHAVTLLIHFFLDDLADGVVTELYYVQSI